jgi:hypothetical protein
MERKCDGPISLAAQRLRGLSRPDRFCRTCPARAGQVVRPLEKEINEPCPISAEPGLIMFNPYHNACHKSEAVGPQVRAQMRKRRHRLREVQTRFHNFHTQQRTPKSQ